jgi:rod shape-determining protein MreD
VSTTEATFDAADDDEFSDAYEVEDSADRSSWISTLAIPLLILVVAIYLQIALAIDARVLGAIPNFALVVLVAFALRFGPAWGAAVGFAAGVLIDIAVQTPLGTSSLVLTPIGWGVGVFSQRRRRVSLAMAVVVLLLASVVWHIPQYNLAANSLTDLLAA